MILNVCLSDDCAISRHLAVILSISLLTFSVKEKELIPNILKGLSASVYTQVSDIEDELNGLLTFDRRRLKASVERIRSMNRALAEEFLASW